MNDLFHARRGIPRPLLRAFLLFALAACAGPARALERWVETRPDGTVVWHDQNHRRASLFAEHGSHCIDEGTNAMARGDGPAALEKFKEAARFLIPEQVKETERGAEALARLHEFSFRFGCRMVEAATNALQRGESSAAGEAFDAAKRFLEICRDSDADDARPRPILANLDARRLLDSIVSSFSVDSTANAIDVELADYELADYWPRRHPWPRWEGPDVGDPPGEPHGEEVETLRSSFRLSAGRRVCFGDYVFGFSFAACPRERISEEVLDRIGPPETAPGPFFVVRRICHPSVRRIHPDYPMRCILLPASFTGAPEAFPFSAGKFLLWPSPEEGN